MICAKGRKPKAQISIYEDLKNGGKKHEKNKNNMHARPRKQQPQNRGKMIESE